MYETVCLASCNISGVFLPDDTHIGVDRKRLTDEVALHAVATQLTQQGVLFAGLDTFGNAIEKTSV